MTNTAPDIISPGCFGLVLLAEKCMFIPPKFRVFFEFNSGIGTLPSCYVTMHTLFNLYVALQNAFPSNPMLCCLWVSLTKKCSVWDSNNNNRSCQSAFYVRTKYPAGKYISNYQGWVLKRNKFRKNAFAELVSQAFKRTVHQSQRSDTHSAVVEISAWLRCVKRQKVRECWPPWNCVWNI